MLHAGFEVVALFTELTVDALLMRRFYKNMPELSSPSHCVATVFKQTWWLFCEQGQATWLKFGQYLIQQRPFAALQKQRHARQLIGQSLLIRQTLRRAMHITQPNLHHAV